MKFNRCLILSHLTQCVQTVFIGFDVSDNRGSKKVDEKKFRYEKIKEHDNKSKERPVVHMGTCMGSMYKEMDGNLTDRRVFNNRLLIGRKYLEGDLLI